MADSDEEMLSHTLQTFVENLKNEIKKGLVIVEGTVATVSVDMLAYTCTVNIKTNTLAFINPDSKIDNSSKLVAGTVSFTNVPLRVLINSKSSFIEIPADNTTVLMTFRDGDFARPQLIEVHECKEIIIEIGGSKIGGSKIDIIDNKITAITDLFQFNDGSFGGITKTSELQNQLNKTNALLNSILNVLQNTVINEPGSGSPSALQAALKIALTGQQLGDYSQIEDTKVKH